MRKRKKTCVYERVSEREWVYKGMCVCVRERERERKCVCMCACKLKRERERNLEILRERLRRAFPLISHIIDWRERQRGREEKGQHRKREREPFMLRAR